MFNKSDTDGRERDWREVSLTEPAAVNLLKKPLPQLTGKSICEGEFSDNTLVLHIGGAIGERCTVTITLRLPPPWDYSSCLGALSSETLPAYPHSDPHSPGPLEDVMPGLIGAKVTLFQMDPGKVVLECASLHIEKRFSHPDDQIQILAHDTKIRFHIGAEPKTV